MERQHTFPADPDAGALLSVVVRDLRGALAGGDNQDAVASAMARAARAAGTLINDGNPRVRAQVRGLALVLQLLRDGDEDGAAELLEGELARSFPGQADFSGTDAYLNGL